VLIRCVVSAVASHRMGLAFPAGVTMSKNDQRTESSPESAPASSREALLELLGDVLKAQETKSEELKAK